MRPRVLLGLCALAAVVLSEVPVQAKADPRGRLLLRILDTSENFATEPTSVASRRILLLASGEVWEDQALPFSGEFSITRRAPADPVAFAQLKRRFRELRIATVQGACLSPGGIPESAPWLSYSWFGKDGRRTLFQIVSAKPSGEPPCTDARILDLDGLIQGYVEGRLNSPQAETWSY
jgi:hypothetical protein